MKAHGMTHNPAQVVFGSVGAAVGILNLVLIHSVPGVACLLLPLVYFPPATAYLKQRFGLPVPVVVQGIVAFVLFLFTLGVSGPGDLLDKRVI